VPSSRTTRIAAALALTVVLAACGGDDGADDTSAADDTTEASGEAVTIELVAFAPEELDVDAGATVTWTNEDPGAHTVTSGAVEQGTSGVTPSPDGRFDSGDIAGDGGSFEHTFDEPGTYEYFCALHPATMRGVINVR
jgi:plastocyanin